MSFDPKTGGPPRMTPQITSDIQEVLQAQNAIQRAKIARGETPDYDPDAPLIRRRCRYGNYP